MSALSILFFTNKDHRLLIVCNQYNLRRHDMNKVDPTRYNICPSHINFPLHWSHAIVTMRTGLVVLGHDEGGKQKADGEDAGKRGIRVQRRRS